MMKKMFLVASLAAVMAVLIAPQRVSAIIGTPDNVPAATLLLPYFEVDLASEGRTTLFSINNASASAALARVTVWTDLGVPTLSFDVYLTGYDVQTINIRDLFGTGTLPQTASVGQDPTDAISNKGDFSQDINYASCNGLLPQPPLTPEFTQGLRDAHTGNSSSLFAASCSAQQLGDNVARGYITVDSVNACSMLKPSDVGYFGGGGIADTRNILWGDYFFVDSQNNFAQGDALVHIEASQTDPMTSTVGNYTFYGHLNDVPWSAADYREPLGSRHTSRFVNGGLFDGGTNLVVWRDGRAEQTPFLCGAPHPALEQQDLWAFDEQENPFNLNALPPPFPARTQMVGVNSPDLPVAPNFGWLYMNLNHSGGLAPPSGDIAAAQSFVGYIMSAQGRFSVSQNGVMIQHASASTSSCIGSSLVGSRCQ